MLTELLLVASTLQDRPRDPDPVCRAELRWLVDTTRAISRSGPAREMSLFSAVSSDGSASCVPGTLSLTAGYFDAAGQLLCSGTVVGIAQHGGGALTQVTTLEIRPGSLIEFARWRNAGRNLRRTVALSCLSSDETTEVPADDLGQAQTLRLWATLSTRYNGLASDEIILRLAP